MLPEYALVQLLKLEALDIDGIKFYTGWTHEKATETLEKCKASGAVERRLYKCQYGYKYAVPTVQQQERIPSAQCLQPAMPTVRRGWYKRHTEFNNTPKRKAETFASVVATLDKVWS